MEEIYGLNYLEYFKYISFNFKNISLILWVLGFTYFWLQTGRFVVKILISSLLT